MENEYHAPDTLKSSMQVNGNNGIKILRDRINQQGLRTMYNGSLASGTATMVGHFPWFFTYNYLQELVPRIEQYTLKIDIIRDKKQSFIILRRY